MEVKTSLLEVIYLNAEQVAKDASVAVGVPAKARNLGVDISEVGYATYCFACAIADTRPSKLRAYLDSVGIKVDEGKHPGERIEKHRRIVLKAPFPPNLQGERAFDAIASPEKGTDVGEPVAEITNMFLAADAPKMPTAERLARIRAAALKLGLTLEEIGMGPDLGPDGKIV